MTAIVDSSVWIRLFKDKTGRAKRAIEVSAGTRKIVMTPPVRMELLQGCRGEQEWRSMETRISAFALIPMMLDTWDGAARIYFELRQAGVTIRSPIDCCMAQLAIESNSLLIHCDRDFDAIAKVRPLQHKNLNLDVP